MAIGLFAISMSQNGCMGCDKKDKKKADTAAAACAQDSEKCVEEYIKKHGGDAIDESGNEGQQVETGTVAVTNDALQAQAQAIRQQLQSLPANSPDRERVLRELAILEQEHALKNLKPQEKKAEQAGDHSAQSAPPPVEHQQSSGDTTQ